MSIENYFKVSFTAQLVKFVLAFRNDCQIDVFWKKGQKIAQSSKVPFNATAYFNESLTISCNMVFDVQTKTFREKITKFEVVLYTDKGTKKVGEIRFDVSAYLNERLKTPKEYEVALEKCPDKNARLTFKLTANVEEKISADAISHSSERTVNVETLVQGNKSQLPSAIFTSPASSQVTPTKDAPAQLKEVRSQRRVNSQVSMQGGSTRSEGESAGNRDIEAQNKKMREKLKEKEKLLRENEELKKKIKNQEYQSVKELKEKIEAGRKQVQRLQATLKRQVLLQKEVKTIEDQIFKCKFQIMNAFNYANERGGGKLMFQMQQACGLKEV